MDVFKSHRNASKPTLACWLVLSLAICSLLLCCESRVVRRSSPPLTTAAVSTFKNLYRQSEKLNAGAATLPFVSSSLGSNMVLQSGSASLWGWTAAPSAKVVATFNQTQYTTVSDDVDGFWEITLPTVSYELLQTYTIQLLSSAGDQATLTNIAIGNVYLCGGQSNMQFTVSEAFNASVEIERANNYPFIRLITVGQGTYSETPLANLGSVEQPWTVASNLSVGGPDWGYFSAVCWFFARDLFELTNVPIGVVSSNWGGTLIQAWSSNDAISACHSGVSASNPAPNQNSLLWNAMIIPFLPMRMQGAVWYQGEQNAWQADVYECAFPAMIDDWRAKFGYSSPQDFVFMFVQLAAYVEGTNGLGTGLPDTRLAQAAALSLPYVGMATAIDLGDLLSPEGDIHPRDKQAVGYRLATVATQLMYNQNPLMVGPTPLNNNFQVVALGLDDMISVSVTYNLPVVLVNNTCPTALLPGNCSHFEVETSDGVWHSAASVLQTSSSTLQIAITNLNSTLLMPTGLRYAYSNWPLAIVYGLESDGSFPATPFLLQTQI